MSKDTALACIQQQLQSPAIIEAIKVATPDTLAKYLTPERVTRMVLSAVSRNDTLLKCTPISIAKAVADAVRLGLEPCGALGHAYLVPYRNNRAGGAWEAQFIPGYRGYIALARRSGKVRSITANVVYSRDVFELDLASGERPKHKPCLDLKHKDGRGDPIAVYAIADFVDGGHHLDLMTIAEVRAIRDESKAVKAGKPGIWASHFAEMARKTVVRRAAKYWPLSIEMAEALEQDNRVDKGDPTVIDASFDPPADKLPPSKTQSVLALITDNKEDEDEAFAQAEALAKRDEQEGLG